jgi:hypothetical protein
VRNGILERNWESASGRSQIAQIIIPWSRVKGVPTKLHSGPSGGHLRINKTLNKVQQRFYWLYARSSIEKWCRECDICAASHGPRTRNRGQMHQCNVGVSFERLAIDVAGPYALSNQGNRYLLIAMDYFTKWLEAYAIPNQEASTVAEALVTNFFCRFGIPRELHSDQGCNFQSHLLQEILQCLRVSKTCTPPLHPQSDGLVERYIKTVEERLRKVVTSHQRDWDERLPLFLLVYRGIHSRHYGLDASPPGVRAKTPIVLRPAIQSTPRQETTHNRSCGRLSGPPARHTRLCLTAPEAGQ